jgi:hypothetical protein
MSDGAAAIMSSGPARTAPSIDPLAASASLWLLIAATGQWLFAYYVVGVYGGNFAAAGLAGFAKTPLLHGYVAGDTLGNIASAAHILLAIVVHGAGPLQLVPWIRKRAPVFHRWNGRAFLVAAVASSLFGLYLQWARDAHQGFADVAGNTVTAALIILFAALALRHAMARNIAVHRRWALRLFLAASAVWFIRLGSYGAQFLEHVFAVEFAPGVDVSMNALKLLVPLSMLELYFWAHRHAGANGRIAVAALLLVMSVLTAVGIYGAATIKWLPAIRG